MTTRLPLRLTRRQTLGVVAAGAAGAAGVRIGLLPLLNSSGAASAPNASGWPSPLGGSRALAAHLLRRAGFGYTGAELDQAASVAYDDLVDKVISQQPVPLDAPPHITNYTSVSQAWYAHMATTSAQFPERMVLFWHGLLTSDYRKATRTPFVYQQNVLYRSIGRSDLRTILRSVTRDPLMMRYLDLGQSTAAAPNENYSRELMELFTLGVGHYSEADVREGARALAGLRIQLQDRTGKRLPTPRYDKANPQAYDAQVQQLVQSGASFVGVLMPRLADQGVKRYLGRTGNLGVDDVIDSILAQPWCAPYLTAKALVYFSVPAPSADYVARIATQFRASNYDVTTLMRAIFTSDEFKAAGNYRSLVRSPADYMVATIRTLGRPELAAQCVRAGAGMDQILYDMPTVAGWPSNSGWLSSSSLLSRVNFATTATAHGALGDPHTVVRDQLDGVLSADTASVFSAATSDADRWFALLASPEFHLK